MPELKFTDTPSKRWPRGQFTGKFPRWIAQEVIEKALDRESKGIAPEQALAIGIAESNLREDNPLRLRGESHFRTDPQTGKILKPLQPLDPREFKRWFTGDESSTGMALDLLKYKMDRYPNLGFQVHQGTGKFAYDDPKRPTSHMYGGRGKIDLRRDKPYDSRVRALAEIFSAHPEIQQMISQSRWQRSLDEVPLDRMSP
jgi:hypothetical protein